MFLGSCSLIPLVSVLRLLPVWITPAGLAGQNSDGTEVTDGNGPSRPSRSAPLRHRGLRALVDRTLGQLDTLADGIAEMVGLR